MFHRYIITLLFIIQSPVQLRPVTLGLCDSLDAQSIIFILIDMTFTMLGIVNLN